MMIHNAIERRLQKVAEMHSMLTRSVWYKRQEAVHTPNLTGRGACQHPCFEALADLPREILWRQRWGR